ncbi:UNVERIFIED_CONTAM: hypothetical protein K2H54_041026 [Gekko kuhli]
MKDCYSWLVALVLIDYIWDLQLELQHPQGTPEATITGPEGPKDSCSASKGDQLGPCYPNGMVSGSAAQSKCLHQEGRTHISHFILPIID